MERCISAYLENVGNVIMYSESISRRMTKLFSQCKNDLKSIAAGQGVWLSSKAWVWAIIAVEVILLLCGVVVYYCTKAKFT